MPSLCKDPSCVPKKTATYNLTGLKPQYCKEHKTDEMVDVKNKKCFCEKRQPSYNISGEPAKYCKECKSDEMVNVKHPKCSCGKRQPSYNIPGKPAKCCSECKTCEMVNVVSPKCSCGKGYLIYNIPGEPAKYCKECKSCEMVNVKSPKCYCGKSYPYFNILGEPGKYCKECKTDDMVDVKNKKCVCEKRQPSYNISGEPAKYCKECKTDEMVNVVSKKCQGYNGVPCPTGYRISKHDYCLACDPDDSRRLAHKRDEAAFFEFLEKDGIDVTQREYRIDYKCIDTTRICSYIDGIIIAKDIVVCLELDEDAHENYDDVCEESRMHDASSELRLEFPGHNIAWVRVNPHTKKGDVRDVSKRALNIRDRRHKEAAALIRDILQNPRDCIEYIGY